MKKTLLIAVAALVAGIISTTAQAQNVYSQNVVGYVNMPIAPFTYQIVGSTMIGGSDPNQSNGDINATLINGLISSPVPATGLNPGQDPNLSTNSQILIFNGSSFITYFYFNQADATSWEGSPSPAGWYTAAGTPASVYLTNGMSAFIYNHSAYPMTVTTSGNVFQGTNVSQIFPGYNLIGLQVPISTNLVSDANGNPLPYGLPLNMTSTNCLNVLNQTPTTLTSDTVLYWNGSSYITYFYFNSADATAWENSYGSGPTYPAGFYDAAGTPMPYNPSVNQGFFIHHIGSTLNWTNSFTVQ
jgi:hypothetical protein